MLKGASSAKYLPAADLHHERRVTYLDGLRGTAALVVAFDHFGSVWPWQSENVVWLNQVLKVPPFNLMIDGAISVYLFFALSGFVLAQSSAHTKRKLPLLVFARYLRLTIPILVTLVFAWVMLKAFSSSRLDFGRIVPTSFVAAYYPSALPGFWHTVGSAFFQVYWGQDIRPDLPLWTMHNELFGSLGIYFIYKLFSGRQRTGVLAAFALAAVFSPGYLCFPLGALLREGWNSHRLRDSHWGWLALLLGVGLAAFTLPLAGRLVLLNRVIKIEKYTIFLNSIAATLILFGVLSLPLVRIVLSSAVPVFLGRISFFFYLLHFPLVFSLVPWLAIYVPWPAHTAPYGVFILFIIVALIQGWIFTTIIDEPLTRWLRRLNLTGFRLSFVTKP